MKKKLLSLVMACAMILSLAVPAFASTNYFQYANDPDTNLSQEIAFTATTFVPTVSLNMPVLPDGGNPVVLNPYKIQYTGALNGIEMGTAAHANDEVKQVISPVYAIENKTDVALKFAVTANTELGSSAAFTFNTSHVSLTEKAKKAYIALVLKKTASASGAIAQSTTDEQTMDPFDTVNNEVVVLGVGEKKTSASVKRLAAVAANSQNYLLFQFQGSLSRSPETEWTTDDVFTTTLTFSFTPEGAQDYTATYTVNAAAASISADHESTGAVTTHGTAADKVFVQGSGAALTAASTPAYAMISGGSYGATVDATSGKVKYSKDTLKALTAGTYTDYIVVGFNDEHNVPRTIGITTTITIS